MQARVLEFIAGTGQDSFDDLARAVFEFQYVNNPGYRRWCEAFGRDPSRVSALGEIPAVPTAVFKELDLVCGKPGVEFRTSGTSGVAGGNAGRASLATGVGGTNAWPASPSPLASGSGQGRHLAPSMDLYRASALAHFRRCVLPEGWKMRTLLLAPPPELRPMSSLSRMLGWILEECAEGGGWFVTQAGLEHERLASALLDAQRGGIPVLLAGTTAAFVDFFDYCDRTGLRIGLPGGSRLMDTGGLKGVRREERVSLADFQAWVYRRATECLGIPADRSVNEYGMTELFSQFYDPVLLNRPDYSGKSPPRIKTGPAWTRTFVIDPVTLDPVTEGEKGLLMHLDLANAGSVMAVMTEDLGIAAPGGFVLCGRPAWAEGRGCGLTFSELAGG